jgi:hypothetical protein
VSSAERFPLALIHHWRDDVAQDFDGIPHGSQERRAFHNGSRENYLRDGLAVPRDADRQFGLFNLLENGKALGTALENASFESYQSVGPNAAALIAQGDLPGIRGSNPLESSKRGKHDYEIAKRINTQNEEESRNDSSSDSSRTQIQSWQ